MQGMEYMSRINAPTTQKEIICSEERHGHVAQFVGHSLQLYGLIHYLQLPPMREVYSSVVDGFVFL